jgi:spermidine/putrescine transport system permease protein
MTRDTASSWLQVLPTWAVLGAFFMVPLGLIFLVSFAPADEFGDPVKVDDVAAHVRSGEYAAHYKEATGEIFRRTYWRSLGIAVATTAICLVVSYPVAYYIAVVASPRWRSLLLIAVAVPFWTSFVIRASAWKMILWPIGLAYTPTAVLIGLVYCELPFMVLPLYASLEKLDRGLLEAAGDLGATPWRAFWRVTVPLTMPGIVAGVVLVFIPSVGQFVVSDLLGGEKSWMVGNLIQFQFTDFSGSKPLGAAVSFLVMSAVLLLLLVYAIYAREKPRPS